MNSIIKFFLPVCFCFSVILLSGCETIAGAGRRRTVSDEEVRYKYERDQLNQNVQEVKYSAQSAEQSVQQMGSRVDNLENNFRHYQNVTGNDIAQLRSEIASLKAENESLKTDMEKLHGQIVTDITGKVTGILNEQEKRNKAAAAAAAQAAAQAAASHQTSGYEHKVCSGETLSAIAAFYKVPIEKIRAANPKKIKAGDIIRAGDTLFVPDP